MREPAYPAARVVASRLHEHFAKRAGSFRGPGKRFSRRGAGCLRHRSGVIDTAFWASLRRVEGYVPRISLALVCHRRRRRIHSCSERPLALDPGALTRVAPAVERAGFTSACGGTGTNSPYGERPDDSGWRLRARGGGARVARRERTPRPAHGQVHQCCGSRRRSGEGRRRNAGGPDGPPILTAFLTFNSAASLGDSANILMRLAVSMRAHGRGGLLRRRAAWPDAVARVGRAADLITRSLRLSASSRI